MSDTPDGLPPLREIIDRHGLRAKKALGQNFLLDLNLTRRIARAAGPLAGHMVVEVGPGPGGLTRALLLEGAERVLAIERDERALPALEEIAARWPGRLEIIHDDALKVDYPALVAEHAKDLPVKVVANLPYNIATPLLTGWLTDWAAPYPASFPHHAPTISGGWAGERARTERASAQEKGPRPRPTTSPSQYRVVGRGSGPEPNVPKRDNDWPPWWTSLTLMFQKEVAERIIAQPKTKAYGRLAVLAQWRAHPRILFEVPPRAFVPPPKVTSAIVQIMPRQRPPVPRDVKTLERVTQAAFGQRRKMLRQALKSLVKDPLPLLEHAGIEPTRRAEELSVEEFVRLAAICEDMLNDHA